MQKVKIDLETAEDIVDNSENMFWDGWTLVATKDDRLAFFNKNGIIWNGRWVVAQRFEIQNDGTYLVPKSFKNGI